MNGNHPGVYVEEGPNAMRPIVGASTANTAFVGTFPRGPVRQAYPVQSESSLRQTFIGTGIESEAGYQVSQFFRNGGTFAFCIRVVPRNAMAACAVVGAVAGNAETAYRFLVSACSPGSWGNNLRVSAAASTARNNQPLFSLYIHELDKQGHAIASESFLSLSTDPADPRYCVTEVNQQSEMVRLTDNGPGLPLPPLQAHAPANPSEMQPLQGGSDGSWDMAGGELADALVAMVTDATSPLATLESNRFNLLCIPDTATLDKEAAAKVMLAASSFCERQRALYLIDPPPAAQVSSPEAALQWAKSHAGSTAIGVTAIYFPRLRIPDLAGSGTVRETGSCGTVAGIYARTDTQHGVWKAPAGLEAKLVNAVPLLPMTDAQNEMLNAQGINAIRTFPGTGTVCWGARILRGAGQSATAWDYVPVRRMSHFLQNTFDLGLKWVAFERNGPALWSTVTQQVETFMMNLFRQGAFQGSTANQAFFVQCNAQTTTPAEIASGRINLILGFAPNKSAEFLVLKLVLTAAAPE